MAVRKGKQYFLIRMGFCIPQEGSLGGFRGLGNEIEYASFLSDARRPFCALLEASFSSLNMLMPQRVLPISP